MSLSNCTTVFSIFHTSLSQRNTQGTFPWSSTCILPLLGRQLKHLNIFSNQQIWVSNHKQKEGKGFQTYFFQSFFTANIFKGKKKKKKKAVIILL